MVTGHVPLESVERALDDTLEPLSKYVPNIQPYIENAVLNALNVYQEDRTPSADAFYRELNDPETKRRKVTQKKKVTDGTSKWIKCLVAVIACAVVVGGAALVHTRVQNAQRQLEGKAEIKFSTGVGKSYDTFQKNWKKYGFSDKNLQIEYRYDISAKKEEIKEFEDYTTSKCLVDGALIKNIKKDKQVKKKKVLAKIIVASSNKFTYLSDWEIYSPQQADDATTYDQKRFCGSITESGDDSKAYGTIKAVLVDGKQISGTDELIAQKEPIAVKNGSSNVELSIYTGDYYQKKKNRNQDETYYLKHKVSEIVFLYGKDENWQNKTLTQTEIGKRLYDRDTVSFSLKEGTITKVYSENLQKGKQYDGRKESGDKIFGSVGTKLTYGVTTVGQLKNYCTIKNKAKWKDSDIVLATSKVTFRRGEEISVTKVKDTSTPKPVQKQLEQNSNKKNAMTSQPRITPKPAAPKSYTPQKPSSAKNKEQEGW